MIMPSISFFIAKDAYSLSALSGFIPSRSNAFSHFLSSLLSCLSYRVPIARNLLQSPSQDRSKDRGKRVRCPLPLLELHTTQQATRLSSVSNPPSSSDFM
jgi:hypothetical protein